MVLQSIEMAEWFTETYYKEVIDFFMKPMNIYGNDMLVKKLKLALHKRLFMQMISFLKMLSLFRNCSNVMIQKSMLY